MDIVPGDEPGKEPPVGKESPLHGPVADGDRACERFVEHPLDEDLVVTTLYRTPPRLEKALRR